MERKLYSEVQSIQLQIFYSERYRAFKKIRLGAQQYSQWKYPKCNTLILFKLWPLTDPIVR